MYYTKKMSEAFPELAPQDNPSSPMLGAFSDFCGTYIGNVEFAQNLRSRGIFPTCRKHGAKVCSIGFNREEQKWYGWSHRAMCGFGIGSKVRKGDCAYVPVDWADFLEDCVSFWRDGDRYLDINAYRDKDDDGLDVAIVTWTNSNDPELIPNAKVRLTPQEATMYPPAKWGRGEWVAETLEDARQMACDFAEDVA